MYQLNFNGFQLYDPRLEELTIRDVSVHLAVDEAGSLSFTIDHDHPFAGQLTRLKGRLELLADGLPIFRGRILSDVQNFDLSRTVEAEGQLACLNDSIVPPFSFPEDYEDDPEYEAAANVVAFWLGKLLEAHNAQVTQEQQIKLGQVTVSDPNNYITRSNTNYATTWATITDKLSGSALGGHLLVRYEEDGTYLDYLEDYPLSNLQNIEFASNLLELTDEIDATEVYTTILPVGAEGLTIAALPDGELTEDLVKEGDVIYSRAGVDKYGRIVSVQTWDDVTEAANLRTKAMELLAQSGVLPLRTISVTAVDLHCTDSQTAALRVGRYTQVTSAPHGLDVRYALTTLEPDILDPGNTRITLGTSVQTLTDRNQQSSSSMKDQIGSIAGTVSAAEDAAQEAIDTANGVATYTSEQITQATQDSQKIIFEALAEYATTSDLERLTEKVSSQLAVMPEKITIEFNEIIKQEIADLGDSWQQNYDNIAKYFDFSGEGLVIGEKGNQITLKIDNDRISFIDGGLEVAYITSQTLVITKSTFLKSIMIGNFEWLPRRNGNLSLMVAGE